MILKLEMLFKKSDARGEYGFLCGWECLSAWLFAPFAPLDVEPLTPLTGVEPDISMATISLDEGSVVAVGHILV